MVGVANWHDASYGSPVDAVMIASVRVSAIGSCLTWAMSGMSNLKKRRGGGPETNDFGYRIKVDDSTIGHNECQRISVGKSLGTTAWSVGGPGSQLGDEYVARFGVDGSGLPR